MLLIRTSDSEPHTAYSAKPVLSTLEPRITGVFPLALAQFDIAKHAHLYHLNSANSGDT